MSIKGRKLYMIMLITVVIMAYTPIGVLADTVTDFENWTPDGNGGYVNDLNGQGGSDGSSDVHVSDEGSGRKESSSVTTESGGIINTETEKQSSVTITTEVTNNNSNDFTDSTNGEWIETDKKDGNNQGPESGVSNNGQLGGEGDVIGAPKGPNGNSSGDIGDSKSEKTPNPTVTNPPQDMYEGDGKNGSIVGDDKSNPMGIASAIEMESVTINQNGEWVLTYRFEDGSVSTITVDTAEEFRFVLTGVKNENGEIQRQEFNFSRSEELTEWIFKYYLWSAVNISFNTSSYYGTGKIVAKTVKNSAVFTLNEAGKYRILATPYHDVRHYHIYEWEDEDGTHTEEITDYWEYDRTKSPDVYSVVIPIITSDGKPIKVCVNGGCDCKVDLNAVCDEANEPEYEINEHAKLEK